ncbi:AlpA family transcriptional regulator [Variovorax paradoxus]|uniref:helix-turn-helix transcriptional regulator n=1 Tax=Variovorax paradoxus TaxID=34073 RepID=UPI003ECC8943
MKKKFSPSQSASEATQLGNCLLHPAGRAASTRGVADPASVPGTAGVPIWQMAQSSRGAPVLLTLRDVARITGMSRSTLYNKLAANEFVRPFKVGVRAIRFLESEVRAWIEERVAQRDSKERGL